ncbi:MAG: hypothetical protein ACP5O0_02440 [Acidimicrobiales bacterium]
MAASDFVLTYPATHTVAGYVVFQRREIEIDPYSLASSKSWQLTSAPSCGATIGDLILAEVLRLNSLEDATHPVGVGDDHVVCALFLQRSWRPSRAAQRLSATSRVR